MWQSQNDNREWDHKIVFEIHKLKGVVWREFKESCKGKISKPLFTAKVGGPQISSENDKSANLRIKQNFLDKQALQKCGNLRILDMQTKYFWQFTNLGFANLNNSIV